MAGQAGIRQRIDLGHAAGMVAIKPIFSLILMADGAIDLVYMVLMGIRLDIGMAVDAI